MLLEIGTQSKALTARRTVFNLYVKTTINSELKKFKIIAKTKKIVKIVKYCKTHL